ncbi:MAG: hypothetical protein JNG88_02970 [Phycisphaerales bacterium]|nr:hypothetical protein [Phycisphaerales bacterium]
MPASNLLERAEGQDDLITVNQLREDVARWRESQYEGVTPITRELLRFWASPEWRRGTRRDSCTSDWRRRGRDGHLPGRNPAQRQAAAVQDARTWRSWWCVNPFSHPARAGSESRRSAREIGITHERWTGRPNPDLLPLTRFRCMMATGSGKIVVMAMLISWRAATVGRDRFEKSVAWAGRTLRAGGIHA